MAKKLTKEELHERKIKRDREYRRNKKAAAETPTTAAAKLAEARSKAHTPQANAKRNAALGEMVKLGWVPGKGWPNGIDPRPGKPPKGNKRKGNGEAVAFGGTELVESPRFVSLDAIPDRPQKRKYKTRDKPRAAAAAQTNNDPEYEFLLDFARLVVSRRLGK